MTPSFKRTKWSSWLCGRQIASAALEAPGPDATDCWDIACLARQSHFHAAAAAAALARPRRTGHRTTASPRADCGAVATRRKPGGGWDIKRSLKPTQRDIAAGMPLAAPAGSNFANQTGLSVVVDTHWANFSEALVRKMLRSSSRGA